MLNVTACLTGTLCKNIIFDIQITSATNKKHMASAYQLSANQVEIIFSI